MVDVVVRTHSRARQHADLETVARVRSPVVISCFVGGDGHPMSVLMSVMASVVVVAGFCALWLVANELEDPFGFDPNGAFSTLVSHIAVVQGQGRLCRARGGGWAGARRG